MRVEGGREGRFSIEREHPHRIVQWAWTGREAAESGALTGTVRMKYWQLNDNGDERLLREIGLAPLPAPATD